VKKVLEKFQKDLVDTKRVLSFAPPIKGNEFRSIVLK
jgi:hypothetical protein